MVDSVFLASNPHLRLEVESGTPPPESMHYQQGLLSIPRMTPSLPDFGPAVHSFMGSRRDNISESLPGQHRLIQQWDLQQDSSTLSSRRELNPSLELRVALFLQSMQHIPSQGEPGLRTVFQKLSEDIGGAAHRQRVQNNLQEISNSNITTDTLSPPPLTQLIIKVNTVETMTTCFGVNQSIPLLIPSSWYRILVRRHRTHEWTPINVPNIMLEEIADCLSKSPTRIVQMYDSGGRIVKLTWLSRKRLMEEVLREFGNNMLMLEILDG